MTHKDEFAKLVATMRKGKGATTRQNSDPQTLNGIQHTTPPTTPQGVQAHSAGTDSRQRQSARHGAALTTKSGEIAMKRAARTNGARHEVELKVRAVMSEGGGGVTPVRVNGSHRSDIQAAREGGGGGGVVGGVASARGRRGPGINGASKNEIADDGGTDAVRESHRLTAVAMLEKTPPSRMGLGGVAAADMAKSGVVLTTSDGGQGSEDEFDSIVFALESPDRGGGGVATNDEDERDPNDTIPERYIHIYVLCLCVCKSIAVCVFKLHKASDLSDLPIE